MNGNSYHLLCIFKSIVFDESIRLLRLSETNELHLKDLERLKKKCIDSYFNKKVVEKIINLAKTWTERFGSKQLNENKTTDPMLISASVFFNLFQLAVKEKSLVQATVVYKRPPTLATMLSNYKKLIQPLKMLVKKDLNLARNAPFAIILTIINLWYIKPVPSQQPMVKLLH